MRACWHALLDLQPTTDSAVTLWGRTPHSSGNEILVTSSQFRTSAEDRVRLFVSRCSRPSARRMYSCSGLRDCRYLSRGRTGSGCIDRPHGEVVLHAILQPRAREAPRSWRQQLGVHRSAAFLARLETLEDVIADDDAPAVGSRCDPTELDPGVARTRLHASWRARGRGRDVAGGLEHPAR